MKRNFLLLAVMILVAFGFSSLSMAQCPGQENDYGECDTLYMEVYPGDDSLLPPGPPYPVRVTLAVTHDIILDTRDSLAGFTIPLKYRAEENFGPMAYCSLTGFWNNINCSPFGGLDQSVFRHMPSMADPQWENWMMAESEAVAMGDWDTKIVNVADNDASSGRFWLTLVAGGSDRCFEEGDTVLLATMTFIMDIDDSIDVYIDTTFEEPSARIVFINKDASGYIPRMSWKSAKQDEEFHFRPFIVPNIPPGVDCPDNVTYNTSGSKTVTGVHGTDADGVINSATVTVLSPCGQVSNVQLVNEAGLGTNDYTADVQFDVDHCAQCTDVIEVTVVDDGQGTGKCTFEVTCTNTNPTINAGADKSGDYNVTLSSDAMVTNDDDGDAVTWAITNVSPATPVANITKVGDHVEFVAVCANVDITYTVTVTATDVCGGTGTDDFTMTVTNDGPIEVNCPPGAAINSGGMHVSSDFSATDPEGEPLTWSVKSVTPMPVNDPDIVDNHVEWQTDASEEGDFTICLEVEDECEETEECCYVVTVSAEALNQVKIPNKVYERFHFGHWDYFCTEFQEDGDGCDNYIILDDACPPYFGINPGNFFEIPIMLYNFESDVEIGGFELEVEFDYIDLTFYGAMRGGLLERRETQEGVPPGGETFWSWEYFTYRVLPCTDLHKYKILLFGQADMPDGLMRRGYCLTSSGQDDGDPSTWWYVDQYRTEELPYEYIDIGPVLVWLKFRVANNELLRDLKLPIFFEWEHKLCYDTAYYICQDWDCAENTFSNCEGTMLYVSGNPLQYNPGVCDADTVDARLFFVDGGVHICSPCTSFVCVRGDINHDAIAYTTADAVLFARYFVEGITVFNPETMDEQICATDVNADGRTLMLADLIYLIRVILQVAPEIPKLGPSSEVVNVIVYDNIITTECASSISAILFEFDGAVVPTLLADMEMVNKGNKVLVWSRDGNTITTAEVLSFIGDAELVSVTAVDYDTRDLQTSITVKVAPSAFALNPAYPNPFNPFTNLSFTLPEALNYSLKIYNVAGQLVRSYEGMGTTGLNVITWDAKDNAGLEVASGVYFYKLTAAGFSATEKMVMMK